MKKIVGIIAAAALAASAFAEVNIGTWNRGVFEPFYYDGDTLRSFEGPSWELSSNGGVRTGLGFSASSENAGMVMDIHANAGPSMGLGDNAYVWVKPVDMLTVKFGKIDNNWGRLDHCFGTWDYARFNFGDAYLGEGLAGIGRNKGAGAEITLQPVEGLVIDYEANFWDDNVDGDDDASTKPTNHTYETMWEHSSTMIGYQADFGFIRAIINGESAKTYKVDDEDTKPAASIALAADITAVENLVLKFGVKIPTYLQRADSYVNAAVAADYNLDALALHANAVLNVLPKKVNDDGDVELGNIGAAFGVGADFAFNDTWKLVADFRFKTWTTDNSEAVYAGTTDEIKLEDPAFGAYLGLQQQLTNATFAFGAQFGKRSMHTANEADDFTFAVPLTMTVSF